MYGKSLCRFTNPRRADRLGWPARCAPSTGEPLTDRRTLGGTLVARTVNNVCLPQRTWLPRPLRSQPHAPFAARNNTPATIQGKWYESEIEAAQGDGEEPNLLARRRRFSRERVCWVPLLYYFLAYGGGTWGRSHSLTALLLRPPDLYTVYYHEYDDTVPDTPIWDIKDVS